LEAKNNPRVDFAERFARNLARHRKAAGLTQEELSVRAGLNRSQVGLIEQGNRLPRIDTFVKLVGALGIPAEELLDGLKWEPSTTTAGEFEVEKP
jgi:transcriptional regulator with XRE-family HTH domain